MLAICDSVLVFLSPILLTLCQRKMLVLKRNNQLLTINLTISCCLDATIHTFNPFSLFCLMIFFYSDEEMCRFISARARTYTREKENGYAGVDIALRGRTSTTIYMFIYNPKRGMSTWAVICGNSLVIISWYARPTFSKLLRKCPTLYY